ncbi:isochorismatase family protein [Endozoicomonas lisbonensis]|uniref:nicotinamidase n=1 Tax=Endozoicomonas lisbonensis TaxID=3120522 RepID=A0ABV2SBP5_9GAMM
MVEIDASDIIASFDVDAQNCFTPLCPDELPVPEGNTIADALNAQAELAHWRVGSKDAHPVSAIWVASNENPQLTPLSDHANSDRYWNLHAVPGTYGFELLEGLPAVTDYDFFVWKGIEPDLHPYGACYHDLADTRSTGVIEFLRDRNTRTVLVGGLALDFCVKVTVLQLLQAGFRVVVNLSATRSLSEATEQQAMTQMREAGAEFINSLDELVFRSQQLMEA